MPKLDAFYPTTSWITILGLSTASVVVCMKLWSHLKRRKGREEAKNQLVARLQSELELIRSEAVRKDEELDSLRRESSRAVEEVKAKNNILALLRGELASMKDRFKEMDIALDGSHHQNQTLLGQLQRQSKELKTLTDEAQYLKLQHNQALDLLKTRTSELRGAQAFLSKADSLSGADVIGMVEGLNTEVSQTAAFVADSFEFEKPQSGVEEETVQEAGVRVSEILGERMTRLLRQSEHADDPMLIQIAFQSAMLGFSEWLIESWYFEEPDSDRFLQEIYGKVRDGGELNQSFVTTKRS
jgi:hypothetical protein